MAFVEPPIASSTRKAFSSASAVMIRSGVRRSLANIAARAPVGHVENGSTVAVKDANLDLAAACIFERIVQEVCQCLG